MKTREALIRLAALALGLAVCLPCLAETPAQIEQRLEQLRHLDAEAAIRRQETLEFQSRRRKEEYARRWKRYGDEEIDVLKWWQQKDGTWVTEVNDVDAQRDTASLPQIEDRAAVRRGDTPAKIAHRYGLTLHELLRLNPGLETARLVVGSQVRIAGSSTGGVTWPELPGFDKPKLSNRPPTRFDASLDSLVRDGAVSADERDRILGMSKSLIGVSCTSLMVNRKPANNGWIKWVRPDAGSPDERLVIDRCASTTRLATP
ncbi:MAG: LysM peptidoglycan-binding domain-containing protein [Cyanobacteria bacterium]|nr:LysM peptidoglycan-binding domain-containing protein [Cyanobacteria bacterium bin.275]